MILQVYSHPHVSDGCLLMFRFCRLRFRDIETPPIVCVLLHLHPFCFACCSFPDVCKDNVNFKDRQDRICSSYQALAINCSHEIMSEDNYAGVVENCPWSCGLCEGWSLYDTRIDLDTNPPVLHPPPSTLCNPSCRTRMLDHPLFLPCGSFASRFVAYGHVYLPLLTSRMSFAFLRPLSLCRLADGRE
jgi:hypothetical protein